MLKAVLAELIGTFTLVLVGAAAVAATGTAGFEVTVPALAHGLVLVGLIFSYGHLSGAHFNPAVTVGLLVGGHVRPDRAVLYIAAQFAGALAAAALLALMLGSTANMGETTGTLTSGSVWQAALIEGVLAFLLVSTIYQSAVFGKAGNLAPLAIGLTLAGLILATGYYTGASINPARSLGPAVLAGNFDYLLPYFVGLFAGGAVGGLVQQFLLKPEA